MWMEEDADKRVNQIRAKEIAETGCDTVAVGCPFCSIMVKDGLDSVGAEMDVKDVAEIALGTSESLETKRFKLLLAQMLPE